MNSRIPTLLSTFGAFLLLLLPGRAVATDGPYRLLKTIPVGGEGGGWDYLSMDEVNRRLYVSHGNSVAVVDIEKDVVAGVITNTPGVHSLAPVPELQRGFTSNGRENKAGVIDIKTLQTVSKIDTGRSPETTLYEPGRKEVYVFNGRNQSATVIDPKNLKVVVTIPLDGRPASAVADSAAGRVYDNLEDKGVIAVIDTTNHEVVARWAVDPGQYPSGLAIDAARHRLFIGCHNQLLVMMDSTNGKVLGNVPIGARVDSVAFDPENRFVVASCGDGTLAVAHEDTPDKLSIVQTLSTERGSRTLALDPKTHRVYVATAKFSAPPPAAPGAPRQGPHLIPETFSVLVYEPVR